MTAPDLTLIQLSDSHIVGDDTLMHGAVDTLANLTAALDAVHASGVAVHGLLLSGDLTDNGSPAAYRRLRAVVEPAAARLRCPAIYAMGNHDERSAFRAALLPDDPGDGPCDTVHRIAGLRIIVLDTTVPGRHDGHLDAEQLDWLRAQLAQSAPLGTVLVLHHPPLPSPVPTVHLLRLKDADRLAAVVAGSDVRLVLSGHAHHTGCGTLAGIPVWVSPALAYRVDTLPPRERLRGVVGSGLTRIDLIDGAFVATAVDLVGAPPVYDRDRDDLVRYVSDRTRELG
ncbi:metallophosphatase [Solihabitans fulvus]|uniref:Metallophosphatase n=1 Tax=Solihabitans fulvus TaxID=1892852 RepID=A0A5B2XEE4_9PSEU|nr:metallophosphoesterase [Solihabitans fulvus]KAA2261429.1 metallophosphatase [Solihabitans fulvus]